MENEGETICGNLLVFDVSVFIIYCNAGPDLDLTSKGKIFTLTCIVLRQFNYLNEEPVYRYLIFLSFFLV